MWPRNQHPHDWDKCPANGGGGEGFSNLSVGFSDSGWCVEPMTHSGAVGEKITSGLVVKTGSGVFLFSTVL